jgi:hypothetical protein
MGTWAAYRRNKAAGQQALDLPECKRWVAPAVAEIAVTCDPEAFAAEERWWDREKRFEFSRLQPGDRFRWLLKSNGGLASYIPCYTIEVEERIDAETVWGRRIYKNSAYHAERGFRQRYTWDRFVCKVVPRERRRAA